MPAQPIAEWSKLSAAPAIKPPEVHIWRANLDSTVASTGELEKCLSADERDRAEHFRFELDRRRFVVRRTLLRNLLASYTGVDAKRVTLQATLHGKPFMANKTGRKRMRFNCSHSAGWSLIAFASNREIGVDLERHQPFENLSSVAREYFSPAELTEFEKLPETLKAAHFFDTWTRKEAFAKAIGLGLLLPLKDFSIHLAPDQSSKLVKENPQPITADRWLALPVDVQSDYSAAVVFDGGAATLRCFEGCSQLFG